MLLANRSQTGGTAQRGRAFTLIEVAITISIVSIISAIALPSIRRIYTVSRANVLANDMRVYAQGIQNYIQQEANYPKMAAINKIPQGMDNYLTDDWLKQTPIGGYYKYEYNRKTKKVRYKVAIGIRNKGKVKVSKDVDLLTAVDRALDDGNLTTGSFFIGPGKSPFYVIER